MRKALQQTYYFQNVFAFVPGDGNPLQISRRQYNDAEEIIKEKGKYIPSEDNPKGEDHFKERRFLIKDCFIELSALSELYEGKNTKIMRIFTEEMEYKLEKIAEALNLPLLPWRLRKD